jgi:hypothetical protein
MSSVEVHVPFIKNGKKGKKLNLEQLKPATPGPITVPPLKELLMLACKLVAACVVD